MTPKPKKPVIPAKPSSALHVRETVMVKAGVFKNTCLELMDEVRDQLKEYVITKHGTVVAKLVAADADAPSAFGFLSGTVLAQGDIVAPDHGAWGEFGK
jgi:antitoxin (DNA-binding transcriptional repressor) of toxin-antitoxin stability system